MISPSLFHSARTLSGSLRSPPSPRGEGFVSGGYYFSTHACIRSDDLGIALLSQTAYLRRSSSLFFIPLPPSNLRPFGAPPSIGRREYPREPLPLEGAAERSEAGLASFWGGKAFPIGEGFARGNGILVSSSIPRKNDRLLRAVVFMCITCLGKR